MNYSVYCPHQGFKIVFYSVLKRNFCATKSEFGNLGDFERFTMNETDWRGTTKVQRDQKDIQVFIGDLIGEGVSVSWRLLHFVRKDDLRATAELNCVGGWKFS